MSGVGGCAASGSMSHRRDPSPRRRRGAPARGAALVESYYIVFLTLLAMLGLMQTGLVFYAKSNVNYAAYEAARAGSVAGASKASINLAFQRAMVPYYGGGTTRADLLHTLVNVVNHPSDVPVRIEILSPTPESFDDYNSPALQAKLNVTDPVIPNSALDELTCPRDVPGCASDPKTNRSGQTLLDANVLKLRITYGIPKSKQMPIVGRFYAWVLMTTNAFAGDAFKTALAAAGSIPVTTSTTIRMQSDAIKNDAMVSSPGKGNAGVPVDPGASEPVTLPNCPFGELTCLPTSIPDLPSDTPSDPPSDPSPPCTGPNCSPDTCHAP